MSRFLSLTLVFAACGSSPAPVSTPAPTPVGSVASTSTPVPAARAMELFTLDGFELSGAEYWPYLGEVDIKYPEEVLWGFYPEAGVVPPGETDPNPASARPEAIACAEQAYAALRAFLSPPPAKLREIIKLGEPAGIVPRIYLWTNDYGRAATPYPPGVREARLWYWKRKQPSPPKPPGYWKWESTLLQSGECTIPKPAQIEAYLDEKLAELRK